MLAHPAPPTYSQGRRRSFTPCCSNASLSSQDEPVTSPTHKQAKQARHLPNWCLLKKLIKPWKAAVPEKICSCRNAKKQAASCLDHLSVPRVTNRRPFSFQPPEYIGGDGEAWPLTYPFLCLMHLHSNNVLQFWHGHAPERVWVVPCYL